MAPQINSTLEAGEITSTQYVCNGAPGTSTSTGLGTVKDANNVTLGSLQTVSTASITIKSPTGYYFTVNWAGVFPDQQIYYSNGDCTGTKWLNSGSVATRQSKWLVYEGKTGQFFVPATVDANGLSPTVAIVGAGALWNGGPTGFSCGAGGNNNAWLLTGITRAAGGLPSSIVPPLTIN